MLIKRFEGANMREVIAQVRATLGPDAIVLSQRTRSERGWFGRRGATLVEVTAAVDRERVETPLDAAEGGAGLAHSEPSWRPLQLTRALIEPLEDELRQLRRVVEDAGLAQHEGALARQVRELRQLAEELAPLRPSAGPDDAAAPFLRAGLGLDLACELAAETRLRERDGESASEARVNALTERLEARLATPRPDLPRGQMVIGAPGVGKTTTLSKLIDRHRRKDLTVLSADHRRRGSSACLRGAAAELGVAYAELRSARDLEQVRDRTLLVDTPGLAAGAETGDVALLRRELGGRVEVQLVVEATTKESDLRKQLDAAASCEPASLIVTHTDETLDLASVVNFVLLPEAPPLAWLGCGESIPEDLALPDAAALSRSVLGVSA